MRVLKIYVILIFMLVLSQTCGQKENSGLADAIAKGDVKKVAILIKNGSDVNEIPTDAKYEKSSPLQLALLENHPSIVQLLIKNKADVNYQDEESGITALHVSVLSANIPMTNLLIQHGARLNDKIRLKEADGYTSLHLAVKRNNPTIIDILIKSGATVSETNKTKQTALHLACEMGSESSIKRLILSGADVNARDINGWTPLHLAVKHKRLQVIQMLMNRGVNQTIKDEKGQTAKDLAVIENNTIATRLLSGEKLSASEINLMELISLGFEVQKQKASDFTLSDLKGRQISLKNYRGKVVFLNIWATWCPPCRAEMPSMEKLNKTIQSKSFHMMAISTGESPEKVKSYVKRNRHSFQVLVDPKMLMNKDYSGRGIPRTYIIGKNGQVLAKATGARNWMNPAILRWLRSLTQSS